MTVKRLWEEYQFLTEKLTEHARKLGFAGVATCWFFKDGDFTFPTTIYFALLGFIVFFILDMLHYFCGALTIKNFTENEEQKLWDAGKSTNTEIEKPRSVDDRSFKYFIAKMVVLITAFTTIGLELVIKLIGKL